MGDEEGKGGIAGVVAELALDNEFLRAQIHEFPLNIPASSEELSLLREEIRSLRLEIGERKEAQKFAEEELNNLRASKAEIESRAEQLSAQLIQAQQKIEQETKSRDDKYGELDSKFQKLHRRAKQKIQEIQKEKDDLEELLRAEKSKAEKASAQQSSAQQDLERILKRTDEALKSMEQEKIQLRSANNKLRENMDELCRALEAKQISFEELQQSLLSKEQFLEDTQKLLLFAEEKKQASILDLSSKHQKAVEEMQAQLTEALSERNKAAETSASLQALIIEKDTAIAKLDAASTGEIARLGAAVEAAKQELNQLKKEHEREIQSWDSTCQALKSKVDASESARLSLEIEVAKTKSQMELELSLQNQTLISREADIDAAKAEISRLQSEFSSYKARAHALLQKKEAELSAARDNELIKAHEEAVKEAEREAAMALAERDKVLRDLHDAAIKYDKDITARDVAVSEAQQQVQRFSLKIDSLLVQHQAEKEKWQKNLEDQEEIWNLRYRGLEAQVDLQDASDLRKQLEELRLNHKKLKEEHSSFCDISERMMEDKEREIAKLKEENRSLSHSLEEHKQRVPESSNSVSVNALQQQEPQGPTLAGAEQQILILARQQAQREEELMQSQRHIQALQEEIEELERENRLHSQQEAMLKEEMRNMERKHKREGVDMTYLKNVILKLLETGEVEALLPVVGTLLQFSPDELKKCQKVYSSTGAPGPVAPKTVTSSDTTETSRSLFSRFTFS